MDIFFTERKTIQELIIKNDVKFVIPSYQRPYVWDNEEILKFLTDIQLACTNSFPIYFIGNVYVKRNIDGTYDLIDGQQRFITLWLISLAYERLGVKTPLHDFLLCKEEIRIGFEIRESVGKYFHLLLKNDSMLRDEYILDDFIKYIAKGIVTIENFIKSSVENIENLGNYINKNVCFVFNIAPEHTDLNSLFTSLGNSGVQLEQTDILKAQLLKRIPNKLMYAKLWEACENMSDYIENNLLAICPETEKNKLGRNSLTQLLDINFVSAYEEDTSQSNDTFTISKIVQTEIEEKKQIISSNKKSRCRSIISFSLLLIHTYRIFRSTYCTEDIAQPIDKRHLLSIFEELTSEPNKIPLFLDKLLVTRFLFDKYIVKWRFDNDDDDSWDDEEKLRLTSIIREKNYNYRSNRKHSSLSMIQSVLYYTGGFNQQYWLTPFLAYLEQAEKEGVDELVVLAELERIDNLMLPGDKKNASWLLLVAKEVNTITDIVGKIGIDLGTYFNHYWFYKTEYLLWKNWEKRDEQKFKRYRITSKNSIEHIFPQNHEYDLRLGAEENKLIDSFGNLTLLSVSQNSSYSNQAPEKKEVEFNIKPYYDSLKLAKYFQTPYDNRVGSSDRIKNHLQEMLLILEAHYYAGNSERVSTNHNLHNKLDSAYKIRSIVPYLRGVPDQRYTVDNDFDEKLVSVSYSPEGWTICQIRFEFDKDKGSFFYGICNQSRHVVPKELHEIIQTALSELSDDSPTRYWPWWRWFDDWDLLSPESLANEIIRLTKMITDDLHSVSGKL